MKTPTRFLWNLVGVFILYFEHSTPHLLRSVCKKQTEKSRHVVEGYYKEIFIVTGFAIHANEPLSVRANAEKVSLPHKEVVTQSVRDVAWFKAQLIARGVRGFEIICGDYEEYFYQIPTHLLDAYLKLRPLKLHRTALDVVLTEAKKNASESG